MKEEPVDETPPEDTKVDDEETPLQSEKQHSEEEDLKLQEDVLTKKMIEEAGQTKAAQCINRFAAKKFHKRLFNRCKRPSNTKDLIAALRHRVDFRQADHKSTMVDC